MSSIRLPAIFTAALLVVSLSGCTGLFSALDQDLYGESDTSTSSGDAEVIAEEDIQARPECQANEDCAGFFPEASECEIATCDTVQQICVLGMRKDHSPCDDGDACTLETVCMEGTCGAGLDLVCDDGNECTDDSCDPESGCVSTFADVGCDDGNECTIDDTCVEGECKGAPEGCPCEEDEDCPEPQDLCDFDEMVCEEGFCVVTNSVEVVCDTAANTDCMANLCDPVTGECAVAEVEGPCSDGSTCTLEDTCVEGVCQPGDNICDCAGDEECAPFDDGDLCNGTLVCQEAKCAVAPDSVIICPQDGMGQCAMAVCMPESGACESVPKMDGVSCEDGESCTEFDQCVDGTCKGKAVNCADGNPCTEDYCEEGECFYDGISDFPCDDGDDCTANDFCEEGECISGENICADCGNGDCEESENCSNCKADCGECEGNCCQPQDAPFCEDPDVVDCVCEIDAYCCEVSWDDVCIEQAIEECELNCKEPNPCGDEICQEFEDCESCPEDCGECLDPEDCCVPHESPGCLDDAIAACVCEQDPFCCEIVWDDVCVAEIEEMDCGECKQMPFCGDGMCDEFEDCEMCPEDCFCPVNDCCMAHEEPGCEDDEIAECVCSQDPFCCEVVWDQACVIEVEAFECGMCGEEPFCGDDMCDEFENCEMCPEDCGPCPDNDCCEPHDYPGCMLDSVMACVCDEFPFCCEEMWDEICVEIATQLDCIDCGGPEPFCGDGLCDVVEECGIWPRD